MSRQRLGASRDSEMGPVGAFPAHASSDSSREWGLGHNRRNLGPKDHMEAEGLSAPPVSAATGRRAIQAEDHQVVHEDFGWEDSQRQTGGGRRHIIPADHLKSEVMRPQSEIASPKVRGGNEMKDAIKECLLSSCGMIIFDEDRWQRVLVQPRGVHWVIEVVSHDALVITREGPSARAIAERLSMMQINELRHFGVRYRAKTDQKPAPFHRQKGSALDTNPTLTSQGVEATVTYSEHANADPRMSASRRHPDDRQRRCIASGEDHWDSSVIAGGDRPGAHGHAKTDDYEMGIPRGIGHGRRHIEQESHLQGPAAISAGTGEDFGRGDLGHGRRYIGSKDTLFN